MAEKPDYLAMAQEVQAMATQVVSRYHGEAREEVDLIFKDMQSSLELADTIARRVRDAEIDGVTMTETDFRSAIPDLKHYEVDPAVIQRVEEMHSTINAWKGELRAQGQAPSGPASP